MRKFSGEEDLNLRLHRREEAPAGCLAPREFWGENDWIRECINPRSTVCVRRFAGFPKDRLAPISRFRVCVCAPEAAWGARLQPAVIYLNPTLSSLHAPSSTELSTLFRAPPSLPSPGASGAQYTADPSVRRVSRSRGRNAAATRLFTGDCLLAGSPFFPRSSFHVLNNFPLSSKLSRVSLISLARPPHLPLERPRDGGESRIYALVLFNVSPPPVSSHPSCRRPSELSKTAPRMRR